MQKNYIKHSYRENLDFVRVRQYNTIIVIHWGQTCCGVTAGSMVLCSQHHSIIYHVYTLLLQDLVKFPGTGVRGLSRGLYLAYLKLHSSVDRICIATPRYSPDILPHVRIRDCPNVTRSVHRP